jgi:hypothetical protein
VTKVTESIPDHRVRPATSSRSVEQRVRRHGHVVFARARRTAVGAARARSTAAATTTTRRTTTRRAAAPSPAEPSRPPMLELDADFEDTRVISAGNFGTVYRARERIDCITYAIKVLLNPPSFCPSLPNFPQPLSPPLSLYLILNVEYRCKSKARTPSR